MLAHQLFHAAWHIWPTWGSTFPSQSEKLAPHCLHIIIGGDMEYKVGDKHSQSKWNICLSFTPTILQNLKHVGKKRNLAN